LKIENLNNL